jgi:hypothetical protein
MSSNTLGLRLIGDLPPSNALISMLGVSPTSEGRKGMPLRGKNRGAYVSDVWVVDLISEGWETSQLSLAQVAQVTEALHAMAPGLTALDRSRCKAELYISTIREDEQGGFELPQALVEAAGFAGLAIVVSILVVLA